MASVQIFILLLSNYLMDRNWLYSGSSTTTFNMGEIYGFYYQFDSELQSPDAASITVTLYNGIEPVSINAKGNEGPVSASESTKANSAFYAFSGNVSFSSGTVNIDPIVVFDMNT